jgi:DNA-binding IclR family transcriptional regulator
MQEPLRVVSAQEQSHGSIAGSVGAAALVLAGLAAVAVPVVASVATVVAVLSTVAWRQRHTSERTGTDVSSSSHARTGPATAD